MIVIDGVSLDDPHILGVGELHELAAFNQARDRGQLFDETTTRRMAQLQLRFDWLGYTTEDGADHPGNAALRIWRPAQPRRRRWLALRG